MMSMIVMLLHYIENLQAATSQNGLRLLCLRALTNSKWPGRVPLILRASGHTILSLFGFDYLKEEPFLFLQPLELFLSLIVHKLKLVLLGVGTDLSCASCFHYSLDFLPVVAELVKR